MLRLDRFLLKTFFPALLMSLLILLPVLVLQSSYYHLKALEGKAMAGSDLLLMLGYISGRLLVVALPLALLASALLTMGQLRERQELVAMQAAGLSLFRIIRPIVLTGLGITLLSLAYGYSLAPRMGFALYDLIYRSQRQDPSMNLKPGHYATDIPGYVIRIGGRAAYDPQLLEEVLIYDYTRGEGEPFDLLLADSARMSYRPEAEQLLMTLYAGSRHQENPLAKPQDTTASAYGRMYFDTLQVSLPLDLPPFAGSDAYRALQHEFLGHWAMGRARDSLAAALAALPAGTRQQEEARVLALRYEYHAYNHAHQTALPWNGLMFLLIGLALGARFGKGGLGVPALGSVAAIFVFYLLEVQGRGLARREGWEMVGAWLPVMVSAVPALFLLWWADRTGTGGNR